MLNMHQQITIKTLKKQGKSNAGIAQELGCHRNTVRNILKRDTFVDQVTRNKSSYFDQFYPKIKQLLDKKVSRLRIYEILGLDQTYDSLCKYTQKHFPRKVIAYGVQLTQPAEEAEADFGYVGLQVGLQPNNQPGSKVKTWVLVVKLSFSRESYYTLVSDQKVGTLIKGLTQAFESWGGVPRRLKVDNLRAAILKNQHYDLQFNQDFLECHHYGCVVVPCTPYSPQQKGKVEAEVKYVANNFFSARKFTSFQALREQLRTWMQEYANKRLHQTTKQVPHQVFLNQEQAALQSLPSEAFSFFNRSQRKVARHCHIFFGNNYYSVPSHLVGKDVTIRFNEQVIRIISQEKENLGEQVAMHSLAPPGCQGRYFTQRSHLPEYKCYGQAEYQQKYAAKMAAIGEYALQHFHQLLVKKDPYWFGSVRTILGLIQEYGKEAVNLSLKRALAYQVLDIPTIKNIVKKELYRLDEEPRLLRSLEKTSSMTVTWQSAPKPAHSSFFEQAFYRLTGKRRRNSNQLPDGLTMSRDLDYYQRLKTRTHAVEALAPQSDARL